MSEIKRLVDSDATREQIELWCRQRAQSYAAADYVVARVLGKYLMYCSAWDSALTPHLALNGIWEPWVTMAIARHVRPGMRCMDVGACYGYYALLMADIVGSAGHVEAWEPVWDKVVEMNSSLNGLPIQTEGFVLGTGDWKYEYLFPKSLRNAGDVKLYPASEFALPGHHAVSTKAPGTERSFDFIKIDVEGREADVWAALDDVRAASPRLTVCMEFTPAKHEEPGLFLRSLQRDGFTIGTVGHDGYPRACSLEEAILPDTGDFRMLWLTKES